MLHRDLAERRVPVLSDERDHIARLRALDVVREAFDNAGYQRDISPGAGAGEFQVEIDGARVAVKVEIV